MMTDQTATSVQRAIDRLYARPLTDFISARDALAKELRAAGDREAASAVKSLRKPSRAAWALNRVAHQEPDSLTALDTAVAGIVAAHTGDGDVRAAMATLRNAVRDYATVAAAGSRSAGVNLDAGELSNALLAVLGNPDSYGELRSGRMSEVPDAGGLDFLASLPARPHLEVSASRQTAPQTVDPAEAERARKEARLAAETLESARVAAEAAAAALADADTDVAIAQEELRLAESELKAAQQRREFARRTNEVAAAELRHAEAVSREAERRLESSVRSMDP